MSALAEPALATCPTVNDSGVTYHFAFPRSYDATGYDTGTLVVMVDENSTVAVNEPCTGTTLYNPTPSSPLVVDICGGDQYRGTGPDAGYIIGLGRTDAATPVLHVVFKINHTNTSEHHETEDAFLVLPKNPDRRGNEYYTLGHASYGSTDQGSRWLVSADADLELNFDDCSGTGDTASLSAGDVYQATCADSESEPDGTGNHVFSTAFQNFGLISGATDAEVPLGVGTSDVLAEMLPGADWWVRSTS